MENKFEQLGLGSTEPTRQTMEWQDVVRPTIDGGLATATLSPSLEFITDQTNTTVTENDEKDSELAIKPDSKRETPDLASKVIEDILGGTYDDSSLERLAAGIVK